MKRTPWVGAVIAALIVSSAGCASEPQGRSTPRAAPEPNGTPEQVARDFVREVARGDYRAAARAFSEKMTASLPPDKLQQLWARLRAEYGDFGAIDSSWTEPKAGGMVTVHLRSAFARGPVDVKVVVDPRANVVSGLWIAPNKSDAA